MLSEDKWELKKHIQAKDDSSFDDIREVALEWESGMSSKKSKTKTQHSTAQEVAAVTVDPRQFCRERMRDEKTKKTGGPNHQQGGSGGQGPTNANPNE